MSAGAVGVAILGAGIGAEHLRGYHALPAQFNVKTICDRNAERAAQIADGIPVQTDIAAVMADQSVDLIDICLPPKLHVEVAIAALEAGKHVICEKPIALSLAEVGKLEEVVNRTGRQYFPVFQYRYGPGIAALRGLLEEELAGEAHVATLETHWNRDVAYYANPWRGSKAGEGGGATLTHAIHIHDLMTTVMGPVSELSAGLNTRINPIETEDCAAIRFEMASGAQVTSSITLGSAVDHSRLRFVFEKLTAQSGTAPYSPAATTWEFEARDPREQGKIDRCVAAFSEQKVGFIGFLEDVALALDGQPNRAVTLAEARQSIELVTAIYVSNRGKNTVSLPLDPNHSGWSDLI